MGGIKRNLSFEEVPEGQGQRLALPDPDDPAHAFVHIVLDPAAAGGENRQAAAGRRLFSYTFRPIRSMA